MKKLLCVLLSVLLIAAVCSGCAGEPAVFPPFGGEKKSCRSFD